MMSKEEFFRWARMHAANNGLFAHFREDLHAHINAAEQANSEVERLRVELGEAQVAAGFLQAENNAFHEQAITDASELDRMQETIDSFRKGERAADAEVERLRAENVELNAAIKSQRDIWNTSDCTLRAEVEWFRRREWIVIAVIEAAEPYSTALHNAASTFKKWMGANPRPGAGT